MEEKILFIEQHPFGSFLPENMRYVVTGTFPGKQFSQLSEGEVWKDPLAWSYAGRNQFWLIMEKIYEVPLKNRLDKQLLFNNLGIGVMDLIANCARKDNNNLDENLVDITWNTPAFEKILLEGKVDFIFCTGKGVAAVLKKWFPLYHTKIIALPSPSPRYASMSLAAKTAFYKSVFPKK